MIGTLVTHRRRVTARGCARPFASHTAPGRRARAFLTHRPTAITLAVPALILARRALAARPAAAGPAFVGERAAAAFLDASPTRTFPWSALATIALLVLLVAGCARHAGWL